MNKKYIWLIVVTAVVLVVTIGFTIAYLISASTTIENTFTIGDVEITLTETESKYLLLPGDTVKKDPVVTVLGNSEDCWLFVKIEKLNNFDDYCTFGVEYGWSELSGYDNVYYRHVLKSSTDQKFPVLNDDEVFVKDTVTEEQLDAISRNPNLNFTAYAIQNQGFDTAIDAWNMLNE